MTIEKKRYAAGVWEQCSTDDNGLVVWSHHATRALAERAARRYAARCNASTGGSLSWAGGVRSPDGTVEWFDRNGDPVCAMVDAD